MLSIDQLEISAKPSGRDPLLKPLTFTVGPGEGVALVGPSGCGKTTLLRTIAGLIDPLGGSITVDGLPPKNMGWPDYRQKVGLVPQRPVVWDDSVRENLLRPLAFKSSKHRYTVQDARGMLGAVGLGDKLPCNANELSEGERQRVCLIRTLLARPDYLLLDEPTSALDEASVLAVEAILGDRMSESSGPGVLVVTHDRSFADRFCSRLIHLSDFLLTDRGPVGA